MEPDVLHHWSIPKQGCTTTALAAPKLQVVINAAINYNFENCQLFLPTAAILSPKLPTS